MKIKFSQGELKRQRDALRQYERYLPTLQLRKQQLQIEIIRQQGVLGERANALVARESSAESWSGLLAEAPEMGEWLAPKNISTGRKNVAGIDVPVFEQVEFPRRNTICSWHPLARCGH